jgi:hypothetical protein
MILNFAYGSNMLSRRLRERVPSARPLGPGVLLGYELRWHKVGKDGSGKCDVVQSKEPDARVLGVLYEIPASEKPKLDDAVGLGYGYDEKLVQVGTASGPVSAVIYYATKVDPAIVPYTWYKALVVAGAKEHSLSPAYISLLEATEAKADPDAGRAAKHFALVDAG